MKRITRVLDGHVVFPNELVGLVAPDNETMYKILHQLAAYEDLFEKANLTLPEAERVLDAYGRTEAERSKNARLLRLAKEVPVAHLENLVAAEKEGLADEPLLTLPKEGDIVYEVAYNNRILKHTVTDVNRQNMLISTANETHGAMMFHADAIGVDIFLTYEEARAARDKKKAEQQRSAFL